MRDHGPLSNAHLGRVGPRHAAILIRCMPLNRASLSPVPVTMWDGSQARAFTIDGTTLTYQGNGAFFPLPSIKRPKGLDVQLTSITFSRRHPAVVALFDEHDARGAPIQIRRALFEPSTGALIEDPHIIFDGFLDEPEATASKGAADQLVCKVSPITTKLTDTLPLHLSNETGLAAGDDIMKYTGLSGQGTVWWGENRTAYSEGSQG